MPARLLSREEVLERLLLIFRTRGYDGASLSALSAATGLGKSSLYHHFPGGKQDMARQVLAHLEAQLADALFEPLGGAAPPAQKLEAMLATVDAFYDGGRLACLLERLCASVERSSFHRPLAQLFGAWIEAVAGLCREVGLPAVVARARAEDLVVRVEGALVVSAGTGDTGVFQRTLDELRVSLLAPAPPERPA